MKLRSVRVQNFRSIRNQILECDNLTVLVGPNGSGKSSFLRALALFYSSAPSYSEDDYFNRNVAEPIRITVKYCDLDDEEREYYAKYVQGDELSVARVLEWPATKGRQLYHGMHLQNPEFDSFRGASGNDMREEYNKLRESRYTNLPSYKKWETAEETLQEWELQNPASCRYVEDKGQFFGFTPVGKWLLEQGTRYIFIPAVRDASKDAEEAKDSSLTQMMDLVVRSAIRGSEAVRELEERIKQDYRQVMDPVREKELKEVENDLDAILKTYVPTAGVKIEWDTSGEMNVPLPRASVRLTEDDFPSPVQSSGHGLQRAYILSMFQLLGKIQATVGPGKSPEQPSFVIAIEEPELYQHPNRQRYLARILASLSEGGIKGVAERTQIIITTHSPLFVDIQKCKHIRKLRKAKLREGGPKETQVVMTNLDEVARKIEIADGVGRGTYNQTTLAPRLRTLMTPWMNEGFFADSVVLVEGEEDRAAIVGISDSMGHDFEALGISVIPCMGKTNLDRAAAIFELFEIPVYLVWDGDEGNKDANAEENHRLLRLVGAQVEDWPHVVADRYTCFRKNLTTTLHEEIGSDVLDSVVDRCCSEFAMKKRHALKHPAVVGEIMSEASKRGIRSETLEKMISMMVSLAFRTV